MTMGTTEAAGIDSGTKVKLSRIQLPFTFEMQNEFGAHIMTIEQKVDNVRFDQLVLPDFKTAEKNSFVFCLENDIHEILFSSNSNYFYGTVQNSQKNSTLSPVILYHIRKSYYGIASLKPDVKVDDLAQNSSLRLLPIANINDLINNFSIDITGEDLVTDPELDSFIENFSMAPPRDLKSIDFFVASSKSPKTVEDPLTFLYGRYFTILYSLTTPLSYFPKTSLTRVKILCENQQVKLSHTLERLYLSMEEMDTRHQGKYGILKNLFENGGSAPGSTKLELEHKNQSALVSKYSDIIASVKEAAEKPLEPNYNDSEEPQLSTAKARATTNEETFSNLVLQLKIREAQLQVILIFEILCSWNTSESEFLAENTKKYEKELKKNDREAKRSLVRNRKQPRKIIPTFLGMGLNIKENQVIEEDSKKLDEYTVYKCLNALIDRLGLWDTLLGNSGSNDNAYGFLGYVLVPYYNKRLPVIVKYVIEKVKDLNMKLVSVSKSKSSTKSPIHSPKAESTIETTGSSSRRSSKYNKTLIRKPLLKKSATMGSLNDNDLLPAFSIKRSKSNLSSKNLQKRQVDMSVNSQKKESSKPKIERSKSLSESLHEEHSDSLIFGNASRLKSKFSGLVPKFVPLVPQIESTPVKPNRSKSLSQIKATPSGKNEAKNEAKESEFNFKMSQIQETPINKQRIIDDFMKTPEDSFPQGHIIDSIRKPSLSNKLYSAALEPPDKNDIFVSPIIDPHSKYTILSTPFAQKRTDNIKTPQPFKKPKEFVIPSTDKKKVSQGLLTTTTLPPPEASSINSSPIMNLDHIIDSSPVRNLLLSSSGTKKRRRPGDPISVQESPFFDTYVHESPIESGIFKRAKSVSQPQKKIFDIMSSKTEDKNNDSDSDYERLISNKSIKTYSKRK